MLIDFDNIFHVRNLLMTQFCVYVGVVVICVAGFETDMFFIGKLADEENTTFILQALMEILTICLVPLALKMFKLKIISDPIEKEGGGKPLAGWGSLRLAMLGVPAVANTLLYYMSMSVAFAYMALICLAGMVFVYPSDDRIVAECKIDTDED